jgi:hypothetical protein
MPLIVMKIERNRGGATAHELRAYALPGQGIPHDLAVACPVNDRYRSDYLIGNVEMSAGKVRRSYPYVTNKHTQVLQPTDETGALRFLAERKRYMKT